VPAGVVSPYSRPNFVSRRVRDHTSVLKLIETCPR
jgi:phospholipase C